MHLGMNYTEVRNLPIRYRRWFIDRLLKYFQDKNNKHKNRQEKSSEGIQSLSNYEEMLNKKF
jgi:uncharacterized protein (UPF0305 family)